MYFFRVMHCSLKKTSPFTAWKEITKQEQFNSFIMHENNMIDQDKGKIALSQF